MSNRRKRSSQVKLILLGGIASGALAGCSDQAAKNLPAPEQVYPNDHYVAGVGYYHAPFNNWYPERYNATRATIQGQAPSYYYGGQWAAKPHESIINLSAPGPEGRRALERVNRSVRRSGFGSSYYHGSGSRSYFS